MKPEVEFRITYRHEPSWIVWILAFITALQMQQTMVLWLMWFAG